MKKNEIKELLKTYIIAADDSAEPIDTEAFVHTVGYVKDGKIVDFLYDSFIFMPQPNFLYDHTPGGTGEKHPMNKAQWTDFIENQEFMSGMNIDALNEATGIVKKELGNSDYKSHAFLSIFYPHNDMHEFGEVDGVNLDLSVLENKKKALKRMVDKSIEEFNKRNYEHIDLGGFYWFYEDIDMNQVMAGLQIQLITYMDAMCEQSEYEASGMLYMGLIDNVVKNAKNLTEEQIESKIRANFKMKGLLLADVSVIKMMDNKLSTGASDIVPVYITKDGEILSL